MLINRCTSLVMSRLSATMRCLLSARKTTQHFLKCHKYGSNFGYSPRVCKPVGWPESMKLQYSTSTSGIDTDEHRWAKAGNNDKKTVDLDITSREVIKPSSPTPHHLRTFNLSITDQLYADCYTPLILFFPNNNVASSTTIVKRLKQSLSEILSAYYPFAGEIKDDWHLACNDKGVNFTEARVKHSLKEFLRQPDDDKVRELVPQSPRTGEPSIGNYIMGVQVNIFDCGGIGLSTSITHKLFDGHTYFLLIKAWAAATRSSNVTTKVVLPSVSASEVFPNNRSLNYSWPSNLMAAGSSISTKRFVFDSQAVTTLKDQGTKPTRMEATSALIWKAAAKASLAIKPFGPQSPHVLFSYVNLRPRASPPLPNELIGNIIRIATAICYPHNQLQLPNLMKEINESIAQINSDHINTIKTEKGQDEILRGFKDLMAVTDEGDRCLYVTSLLNRGIYDIDFGWGTPIWFYDMNAGFKRIAALNDTLKGGGVEATITLSSDEMEIFETDPELLSYVTVDSSPLQYV